MGNPKTTDFIFVYGTLRSQERHPMARLVAGNARYLGKACFQGRLYLVNKYPGAVPSENPNDKVLGEVFLLSNKKKLLPILDKYEACSLDFPKPTEFIRTVQSVRFTDGRTVSAWIYLYNFSTAGLELIKSGDYRESFSIKRKKIRDRSLYSYRSLYQPYLKKRSRTL